MIRSGYQNKVHAGPAQSFTPAGTGILQRKCTLCNTPGLVADSERDEESPILQRSPVDRAEPSAVPPIVHEVLRLPGQPLDPETRAVMELRFGHDFGRVSVFGDAPAMIQAKLSISQPNDAYEQEADRVADEVMRISEPQVHRQLDREEEKERLMQIPLAEQISPLVQRQVEEGEEEELLQTKEHSSQLTDPTSNIESQIQSLKSSGQPLSESTRTFFEPRFGQDFSQVRVHTDARAGEIVRAVNARAFTVGQDVVFGVGEYAPETELGRHLLAHELVHVIQQGRGTASQLERPLSINKVPVIQRSAYFRAGPVNESIDLAAHYIANYYNYHIRHRTFPLGFMEWLLNGRVIRTAREAGAMIHDPTIRYRSGFFGSWTVSVDTVDTNVASYTIELPTRPPWSTLTHGFYVNLLFIAGGFPSVAACFNQGNTTFSVHGIPDDASLAASVRTHEGRHVSDWEMVFNNIIVPWDRNLQAAKTSRREFSGPTVIAATTALYNFVGGTPDAIGNRLFNAYINRIDLFHNSSTGRGPRIMNPTVYDATCTTSSLDLG